MDNSPIFELKASIEQCLERIAPEKKSEISKLYEKYEPKFCYSNIQDFSVSVDTSTSRVTMSVYTLEYLWAACYTYYLIYQKYQTANRDGASEFDLHGDSELVAVMKFYKWGQTRVTKGSNITAWVDTYPNPKNTDSLSQVANELFLCALAWILHHEIAHVYHAHPNIAGSNEESREQEKEADASATNWIMNAVTDQAMVKKRGLGISIAILAMTAQDILSGNFDKETHPRSFERLDNALVSYFNDEDHVVYAFSTTILHVSMTLSGLPIDLGSEQDTWKDHFVNCLISLSRQ